jgi:putative hemolysin
MGIWLELAVLVALAFLNGFFALAEMAVVSSRRIRLQQMADGGSLGAAHALALAEDPGKFLSSVQVGITLISIVSGAFGGATLGARLGPLLDQVPYIAPYGERVAFVLVVIFITTLSVVIGELVPKRTALSNPERIAAKVARPLGVVAAIGRPLVWFFETLTEPLLKMIGAHDRNGSGVTEEEVKFAIAEGTEAGVIAEEEQEMIEGVLELADRSVDSIMTPRPDVYWIDLDDESDTIARDVAECPYSRIVVARDGDMSRPLGVVQKKDLVADLVRGNGINMEAHLLEPMQVPEGMAGMRLLQLFRTVPLHLAFVFDEYGDFQGIVTVTDVMRAIAGELPEEHGGASQELTRREDGSWLVDGRAAIDEVREMLGLDGAKGGDFHTAAGLALDRLGRIPTEGESFEVNGWRVEVIDMDGNRIDKLLFTPPELPAEARRASA